MRREVRLSFGMTVCLSKALPFLKRPVLLAILSQANKRFNPSLIYAALHRFRCRSCQWSYLIMRRNPNAYVTF
jgi:hypothetical protein